MVYSIEDRVFIVKSFYKNDENWKKTKTALRFKFGNNNVPARNTVKNLIEKFERLGTVENDKEAMTTKKPSIRTPENIDRVREFYEAHSQCTSLRKAGAQLGISKSSLQRINRQDLKLYPYKIQIHQPISENATVKRLEFANIMIDKIDNQEMDIRTIVFSDEAHFHLDGYINKQNMRFWGSENPHISTVKPLHPKKITVWCGICSGMIIGPIFIENKTINAEVYLEMLKNEVLPTLQGLGMVNSYHFMQDGARPHRTFEIFEFLSEHFSDRLIGLDSEKFTGNGIDWPPYSPDLNPCDFFLWGYMKDEVYKTAPKNIGDLKTSIEEVIKNISEDRLLAVIECFETRLRHVIAKNGGNFENLIN